MQNVSPHERSIYQSSLKPVSPSLTHYNVEPISPPTHSRDNSPHMPSTYNTTLPTTWSPTAGVQSAINNRHYYNTETSNPPKPSQQIVNTNQNPNPNRTNQSQIGLWPLDYVKNRIVEVMRTTSDDTVEDVNKRTNSENQNDKIKEEKDSKLINSCNFGEGVVSIDSTNKSGSVLRPDNSKSPTVYKNSIQIAMSSSHLQSSSPSSSQNAILIEDNEEVTPAKKMKMDSNEVSTECDKVETSTTVSKLSNESTNPLKSYRSDNKSIDCETTITQSSIPSVNKSDECIDKENIENISSSEMDEKSSQEKFNCEVSSAENDGTSAGDKQEIKHIYPDSPNSPGEMVIDESDQNPTSLSPNSKVDETPTTSSTHSSLQCPISTSDVHKSDSNDKTSPICSSSEIISTEVPNQSHSISSSVHELKDNSALPVSGESSAEIESSLNSNSNSNPSAKVVVNPTNTSVNPSNSISSTGQSLTNVLPTPYAGDSSNNSSVNTSGGNDYKSSFSINSSSSIGCGVGVGVGRYFNNNLSFAYNSYLTPFSVSSSIGINSVEPLTQSTGSSSIQSSTISASGTPTSTTNNISAPQYEPLSDDE